MNSERYIIDRDILNYLLENITEKISDFQKQKSTAPRFQVGDKVQRRAGVEEWRMGYVTQLDPLKVNMSATDPSETGYTWDEVRPYGSKIDGYIEKLRSLQSKLSGL